MSYKKVAFFSTFTTDKPDPQPEPVSVYQRKPQKTEVPDIWVHMSAMTCRDFSKNTYSYRDKHFSLTEEGITYELPPHLRGIYEKNNQFQRTEFRKLPLKPGKLRNQNKKTFRYMSASSLDTITEVNRS